MVIVQVCGNKYGRLVLWYGSSTSVCDKYHMTTSLAFTILHLFTRSIYHKKVKQIDSNQKLIKKTRIAKGFLENRSRDFWSEISKIRRKTHITPCTVEGFSNNEDISSCFSSYYKDLYNSVSFDSIE